MLTVVEILVGLVLVAAAAGIPVWFTWYSRRQRRDRQRAETELPVLAQRLGLRFELTRRRGSIGELNGTYGGRAVRVTPDEEVKLRVTLPALSPYGRSVFQSQVALFDLTFPTPELAARWRGKLHLLDLDPQTDRFELRCSPKQGVSDSSNSESLSYVLPEDVEALLPLLVAAARHLESASPAGDG